jgi:excisionase family DNA binding protein
MPRTRKRPDAAPQPTPPPANGSQNLAEVLTLAEAAGYFRLSDADVLQLVQEQGLPARQVGAEWRFLKAAIDDWLRAGPGPRANKEAWMALAGAWKDDPLVEEELKEIYRQRGRPMTEDEA